MKKKIRVTGNIITEITSKVEIQSIEEAIQPKNLYAETTEHLKRALELLSDRNKKKKDYRNSTKESISAIEALNRKHLGSAKQLSELLKSKNLKIDKALQEVITKLYAFRGNASGVGHSLKDTGVPIAYEEALFTLVTASAIVNYLKLKFSKEDK